MSTEPQVEFPFLSLRPSTERVGRRDHCSDVRMGDISRGRGRQSPVMLCGASLSSGGAFGGGIALADSPTLIILDAPGHHIFPPGLSTMGLLAYHSDPKGPESKTNQ